MPSLYSSPLGIFNNPAIQKNPQDINLYSVKKLILNDLRYSIVDTSKATAKYLRERRQLKERSVIKVMQPLSRNLDNVLCITDSVERKLIQMKELNGVENRLKKAPNEDPMHVQKKNNELGVILSSGLDNLNKLRLKLKAREQKSLINTEKSVEVDEFIYEKEDVPVIQQNSHSRKEESMKDDDEATTTKKEVVNQKEEEIVDQHVESDAETPESCKKKPAKRKRFSYGKKK